MKRDRQSVNLRHAEMLAMIRDRQEIMVEDLARAFDISPMTVRRDLQVLEEQGKISRFHGGASVDTRAVPGDEKERVALCQRLIARCAAQQVASGDTLFINGSNTALALLDQLGDKTVTVFTNNAMVVGHRYPRGVDLQLSGGTFRGSRHILTGDLALKNLMDWHANRAFLGCIGISPQGEILCGIPSELGINETMIEHAESYYILADYTKIGKAGTYASFHLEKKGCVITDEYAPEAVLEQLRASGMQVIQARAADFPRVTV